MLRHSVRRASCGINGCGRGPSLVTRNRSGRQSQMYRFNSLRGGRLLAVPVAVALLALGLAGAGLAAKKADGHFMTGDDAGSSLALRLAAGDASVLQVDAGDDRTADASVRRERFDAIQV